MPYDKKKKKLFIFLYSAGINILKAFTGGGASDETPAWQCRRHKRHGWVPSRVGKTPWRRGLQSTFIFLPGESHGQRRLVGYSLYGCKELDTTEATEHACTQTF